MPLVDMVNKPCLLIRRLASNETDELGNEKLVDDPVETVCEVQQEQSDEPEQAGEASESTWLVVLLPGYEARTGDALVVDGYGEFEFIGNSWNAEQGSPDMWHVEGKAKQTKAPEAVGS